MLNRVILRLAIPLIIWFGFYFATITNMVEVWSQSKTYEHCYLIIPISLWLFWQKKDRLHTLTLSNAWLPAVLLLFPCFLWLGGHVAHIAFFEHVAAVISLQLILWAMLGHSFIKVYYFPILYLLFCIPFGEELIPYLQNITANISVELVRLTGIPIYKEGLYLSIPNGQFEVAEACSGIRFLISSIALGTLFAYVFFKSWWKFLIFVLFSSLFPILANGIRVFGTIVIGYYSDMKYASSADHLIYGWVFFSLVIVCLFFIGWFFQDNPFAANPTIDEKAPTAALPVQTRALVLTISVIVLIFMAFLFWNTNISQQGRPSLSPFSLPTQLKTISQLRRWHISFPNANQTLFATNQDNTAQIFIARYQANQEQNELISSDNVFYDKDLWSIEHTAQITIDGSRVTKLNLINQSGEQRKSIMYTYCINRYCSNNPIKIKLAEIQNILLNRNIEEKVTAISSSVLSEPQLQQVFTYANQNTYTTEKYAHNE